MLDPDTRVIQFPPKTRHARHQRQRADESRLRAVVLLGLVVALYVGVRCTVERVASPSVGLDQPPAEAGSRREATTSWNTAAAPVDAQGGIPWPTWREDLEQVHARLTVGRIAEARWSGWRRQPGGIR